MPSFDKDLNKLKLEQFPLDEIVNEDDRIARGWMSVEVRDSDDEIIPITDLKRSMNTLMKRGGFVTDQHTNRVVGKILTWKEGKHKKSNKDGIIIDYQIFKDYSVDNIVWDEIKSKKRKGLSFGGRALDKPKMKNDADTGEPIKELKGIEAYEVASVTEPANQLSENVAVNFLAKSGNEESEKLLTKDLQKGFNAVDIQKPFAGFKDFDGCVASQQERGHSEESANRVCGWLQHRSEDDNIEENKDKIKVIKKLNDIIASIDGLPSEANKGFKELINKIKADIDTLNKQTENEGSDTKPKVDTMTDKGKKEEDKRPEEEEEDEKKSSLETKMDNVIGLLEKVLETKSKKEDEDEDEDEDDEPKGKKKEDTSDTSEGDATAGAGDGNSETSDAGDGDADAGDSDADTGDADKGEDEDDETKSKSSELKKADIDKMVKAGVETILKANGIIKTKTPRAKTDIVKNKAPEKTEMALDFLEKAKKGEISLAEINRTLKTTATDSRDEAIKAVLGK